MSRAAWAAARAASAAACWCARVPQAFQQVSHAVRWCLVTDRDSSASRRHAISALRTTAASLATIRPGMQRRLICAAICVGRKRDALVPAKA